MTALNTRFVIATDWSHPGHVMAGMRAYALLGRAPARTTLVVTVPHDPGVDDERRLRAVLGKVPVDVEGELTVESFEETRSLPYEAAIIPRGDADVLAMEISDWVTRLALADKTMRAGHANSGGSEDLRIALSSFDEGSHPSTAAQPALGSTWYGQYIGGGKMLAQLRTGGRVYLPADNRATTPNILQTGVFEPELHAYIRRELKPGDTAVDVGANIGVITVALARAVGPTGRVIALEPVPSNLKFVRWNIETNWLMDIVTVHEAAAADIDGSMPLRVSDDWNSLGSLTLENIDISPGHMAENQRTIQVNTTRLDTLLAGQGPIEFVKVDVEGAEDLVFRGMADLLESHDVKRVAFECMQEHLGSAWSSFAASLTSLEAAGWSFSLPRLDGSVTQLPVSAITANGDFRNVIMEAPGLRAPVQPRRV